MTSEVAFCFGRDLLDWARFCELRNWMAMQWWLLILMSRVSLWVGLRAYDLLRDICEVLVSFLLARLPQVLEVLLVISAARYA